MRFMTWHQCTALCALLLAVTAGGCLQSPGGDEEELEHQIPPHKPRSLAAAVIELERRNPGLPLAERDSSRSDPAGQRQELEDIIRWLPELAADSDLKKENWDALQRLAIELEQLIRVPDSNRVAGGSPVADGQFSDAYRKIVAQLRLISELTSEPSWPDHRPPDVESDPSPESHTPTSHDTR